MSNRVRTTTHTRIRPDTIERINHFRALKNRHRVARGEKPWSTADAIDAMADEIFDLRKRIGQQQEIFAAERARWAREREELARRLKVLTLEEFA